MNTKLPEKKAYLGVLFLILISALVYLPYAMRLRYYLDDWYYIYDGIIAGPNVFHSMFTIDRPARGYFFDVYFSLFGPHSLPYHLGAYLWRLLAGLSALWLFNILWTWNKRFDFFIALLFILYPGYSWWVSAIEYQPMIASLALQVLSVVFTLKTLQTTGLFSKIIYTLGAIFTGWIYIALVDYAIGMEVFRFICVYVVISQKKPALTVWKKIWISIRAWIWNALIPVGFIFWRLFLFESQRKATDISLQLSRFTSAPIDASWKAFLDLFNSIANAGFHAWYTQLYLNLADSGFKVSNLGWILTVAIVALLIIAENKLSDDSPSTDSNNTSQKVAKEAIFLGALSLIFGVFPVVIVNRYVNLNIYSHYGLPASLPSAILLGGLIYHVFISKRFRASIVFVFVAVSVLTHSLIAEKTILLKNAVETFWWQASWRIPNLRPDATLLTLYPYQTVTDTDLGLAEPPNLIYFPDPQNELPIRYPVSTLMPTDNNVELILALSHRKTVRFRTNKLIVSYDNILILSQPTPLSCVRAFDGTNYVLSEKDPENIRKIASYSRIENIRTQFDFQSPPEFAFGPEPDHGWCYFFQKADFAVQTINWEEAARLGDEALGLGLYPLDPVEWFPFIQAYAMVGDTGKLEMISMQTKLSVSFESQVCEVFRRPDYALSPNVRMRDSVEKLFCD
jgi:hypothetical protein